MVWSLPSLLPFPDGLPMHVIFEHGRGCMLRTGQMLVANTLQQHLLGRSWRLDRRACDDDEETNEVDAALVTGRTLHAQILRWYDQDLRFV